jgi:hypothetical protein
MAEAGVQSARRNPAGKRCRWELSQRYERIKALSMRQSFRPDSAHLSVAFTGFDRALSAPVELTDATAKYHVAAERFPTSCDSWLGLLISTV